MTDKQKGKGAKKTTKKKPAAAAPDAGRRCEADMTVNEATLTIQTKSSSQKCLLLAVSDDVTCQDLLDLIQSECNDNDVIFYSAPEVKINGLA